MAFRFQRRVTLFPGVRLNFSKSGVSVSAGIRGASVTAGKRGIYGNMGAPGTGMSYRTRLDNSPAHQRRTQRTQQRTAGRSALTHDNGPATPHETIKLTCDERGKLTMQHEDGTPAARAIVRRVWDQHADEVDAFLQSELERINDGQALLLEIHHDTPPLETPHPAYTKQPFEHAQPQVPDLPELPTALTAPTKRWWHKLFAYLERRRVAANEAQYTKWQAHYETVHADREAQEADYQQRYNDWQQAKHEHDSIQQQLADAFDDDLRNDVAFMAQILESELTQLDWPRETHVDFDIVGALIKLDVDLPTADEFPSREAHFNKARSRLLVKDKSATQQRKEYAQHVHGVLFRLIGVVFATLPAIETAKVAGYTQAIDSATGHEVDEYLLEVTLTRAEWSKLNLAEPELIDPVAALEQFELRREMSKTGMFRALALQKL